MPEQIVREPEENELAQTDDEVVKRKSPIWSYVLAVAGVVLTVVMILGIVYYNKEIQELKHYGYLGAFFISILGGATIIVPVPMLAVVFALGGAMANHWQVVLLGLSAAAGELIGALIIYYTGHGAGRAISRNKHGRIQKAYEKMLDIIERRGSWALFAVTSVVNPFFYPAAFACGALRFGIKRYITIVLIGKIIKCMTVVYAGYYGLKGIFNWIGIEV